jgi:putative membrane-bound dehydrogenase-like protein
MIRVVFAGVFALCAARCFPQGFSPSVAASKMTLEDNLQVSLVAAEPMITQPVCIEFDDRGRLWVVQYVQYPNPSGLQRAKVDRWSRTTYDRVPDPPPRGPKGADRITILEDRDGDGKMDDAHDFVSGLNLATGIAFGHGGVFVLNVPYLLFYPDRDGNDVPDTDPDVLLTGFGMEDAHSVANSLTWGPDGWLYGCQGSTVTARVRGIEFQQGVWRYHPLTHEFELFCEGGGNSWGLDFDAEGELIYSTNAGPYRCLHGVQGAYLWKSFGKHGPLHNPYAFGWFDHIPQGNPTGGHVAVGGLIYQERQLPERYRGRYVCGDLLGHGIEWNQLSRRGTTFSSAHAGYALQANDTWFAPSDLTVSPDGALYVSDWCDQRTAHPDPDAAWDRSNGRIYRISTNGSHPIPAPDLQSKSSLELVALLLGANDWTERRARHLLADRRDASVTAQLLQQIRVEPTAAAVQALWALNVSGGFDKAAANETLTHSSPVVRKWAVRLLGDARRVTASQVATFARMAAQDASVRVRAQLASTAKRLPPSDALPVLAALIQRDSDAADPYVPLLIWWALEAHAVPDLDGVLHLATNAALRDTALMRDTLLTRLMRRWIAEGTEATQDAAAELIATATSEAERARLFAAMAQGFDDRPVATTEPGSGGLFQKSAAAVIRSERTARVKESISPAIAAQFNKAWQQETRDATMITLGVRLGRAEAETLARALATDASASDELRARMISLIGTLAEARDVPLLMTMASHPSERLALVAMDALTSFEMPELGTQLLRLMKTMRGKALVRLQQVLLSRKDWARELLLEVDAGRSSPETIARDEMRVVAQHGDAALDALVAKHWGRITNGTPEEKLAEIRRLNNDLRAAHGDAAKGQIVFTRLCVSCHMLHGTGGRIGPDLTQANRADREFLLQSLVDPSATIRREYLASVVETMDGRVLTGVNADEASGSLVLGTITGGKEVIPLSRIRSVKTSDVSLMPEGLLKTLTPQELRDLFAFLESKPPGHSTK